jgi:hypothetical protein
MATTYAGINSFGRTAGLGNVSIKGSGGSGEDKYVNAALTTTLKNPSNVSLQTNGLSLAVFYKDVKIGRAAINVCSFTSKARGALTPTDRYLTSSLGRTRSQQSSTTILTMPMTPSHRASSPNSSRLATPFPYPSTVTHQAPRTHR